MEKDPKVQRWKLAVQEFDCFIEHIAGKKNIVADGLSRLLNTNEEELYIRWEFEIPHEVEQKIEKVHNSLAGHGGVERQWHACRNRTKNGHT